MRRLVGVFAAALLLLCTSVADCMTLDVLPATGTQPEVVSPNSVLTQLYDKSFAIVISESHYASSDASTAQWPTLDETTSEQDKVATALRAHGFVVWRVKDANGQDLRKVIRNFFTQNGNELRSRVVFIFSGHGYTNPKSHVAYLVPIDAPRPDVDRESLVELAVPILDLQTYAREIEASHALFLFDSCFSGRVFLEKGDGSAPAPRGPSSEDRWRFLKDAADKPVRQFISAGGALETLPSQSAFSSLFVQALANGATAANDGYVSGKEIGLFLEQRVPNFVSSEHPHSGLIRDAELAAGDMIFQIRKQTASSSPGSFESIESRLTKPPFLVSKPYQLPLQVTQILVSPEFDQLQGEPVRYSWRPLKREDFGKSQPCFGQGSYMTWFFEGSYEVRRISLRLWPDAECPNQEPWADYLLKYFGMHRTASSQEYFGELDGFKMWKTANQSGGITIDIDEPSWSRISFKRWTDFHMGVPSTTSSQ